MRLLSHLVTWWLGLALLTGIPVWVTGSEPWTTLHASPAYLALAGALAHAIVARGSRRAVSTGIAAGVGTLFAVVTGILADSAAWALAHSVVLTVAVATAAYLHIHGREFSWRAGGLAVAIAGALAVIQWVPPIG